MVFNGIDHINPNASYEYNLKAANPQAHPDLGNEGDWYDYINCVGVHRFRDGTDEVHTSWVLYPNGTLSFNHDLGMSSSHACFGYGIYKVVFGYDQYFYNCDSLLFEQDVSDIGDNTIRFENGPNGPRIVFHLQYPPPSGTDVEIKYDNIDHYFIKPWQIYGRSKNFGNFIFDSNSPYNVMPVDCRRDCNIISGHLRQNHFFPGMWGDYEYNWSDVRQGNLTMNLTINKNVSTPPTSDLFHVDTPYTNQISVTKGAKLTINDNCILTLRDYDNFSRAITMTVKDQSGSPQAQSGLVLNSNSTLNVQKNSMLYLEHNSRIYMQPTSKIVFGPYGMLCNKGAIISGGNFMFHGSRIGTCFNVGDENQIFQDSAIVLLEDSAEWVIQDSATITLDGNVTSLIAKPDSKIIFGHNSKLILQNGAHLIADHATFTSLDPSSTWDGIYLYDISNDTITNCTIENAANGVNIKNKYSFTGNQPSTEISNCTFSNTTSTQLTNGIYASASNNVLIRNNNFTSSQLVDAFANGIMLEYCPSGAFDIIDNHLDKVHSGIAVIQSSPYIARNTITGLTSDGDAIYLDNSNGTVKYNNTNYSNHSLIAYYSSPYLLKNNFNNANDINIDLHSNSVPVMRPINSGTTLRWLAGNNLINGTPLTCGISFNEEAYPSIDSGYNNITVNGSNYMNGVLPSLFTANLPASYNYWGGAPNPQKFSVTPYSVDYNPTFDGSTLPPTNYTELNDIGFGLYDTVYVENLGDNPGAEILFMQAYNKEMAAQYVLAISLYKQVILNYRRSDYAPVSLSRIFNCFEKRISSISDYQLLQNYMNQLRINSNYPAGVKELAEDFMIKSKVRQGLLDAAIYDYQLIYQQNQNNSKGLHALINKECLVAMKGDTTDNPSQSNTTGITQHKLRLLSLIIGRNLTGSDRVTNSNTPKEFKLYQSYPNPFNPTTTIKYDLPKSGDVSIRIYDLLGKEIYSMNEFKLAGSYSFRFDGSNYASGVYFYKIEASSFTDTKKMVLLK
jgi:hypothetical protein